MTITNNKLPDWLGPIPHPGKLEEQRVVKGETDRTGWLQPTYTVTIINSTRLPAWLMAIPTSERKEEKKKEDGDTVEFEPLRLINLKSKMIGRTGRKKSTPDKMFQNSPQTNGLKRLGRREENISI